MDFFLIGANCNIICYCDYVCAAPIIMECGILVIVYIHVLCLKFVCINFFGYYYMYVHINCSFPLCTQ